MTDSPADHLTVRDLRVLHTLVERWASTKEVGSKERDRADALLRRLAGEDQSRPPSLTPAIARAITDVVTQGPERAAHAVEQLAEALYRAGDVEASPQLRKVAEHVRRVKSEAVGADVVGGRGGAGGGGLAAEVASLIDQRCLDWYDPLAFRETMVLDRRLQPVLERLVRELKMVSTFLDLGVDAPTRVLFHGPSGVGKTLAARWIGARLEVPVALVRLDGVESPVMGQTVKNLRHVFDSVARRPGALVFLDEIDGIAVRRDDGGGSFARSGQQVTSALLQQLDAMPKDQVVIAATNFPEKLDPALSRRVSTKVEFTYPDAEARRAMLGAWWSKVKVDGPAVNRLVAETDRRSGDFLRSVAMSAARLGLTDESGAKSVTVAHVQQALSEAVPPEELRRKPHGDPSQMN